MTKTTITPVKRLWRYRDTSTYAGRVRERILRDFMTASEQSAKMHMIATMRARQDFPKMSLSAKFYQEEAAYWHKRACAHREAFNNVAVGNEPHITVRCGDHMGTPNNAI